MIKDISALHQLSVLYFPFSEATPTSTTALPSTGDPIPPPETVQPVKKNALKNVDVDAFFDNPLNRNPLLKRLWKL
jgi:hypothetical protein